MEPKVRTIVLHPAILIASGFESITSRQVRFLNAHRSHFYSEPLDFYETIVISKSDFDLGGMMNPFGNFFDINHAYRQFGQSITNFPYLTRLEVLKYIYESDLSRIWVELLAELFGDLSEYCVVHKRTRDYFKASTQILHELSNTMLFQKISALHSCGLGGKLLDAFDYVFKKFVEYEKLAAEPFVAKC